ncbi:MAG: mucoidy inhibitor MuiA family protein [Bacteroidales bacterium]|nr:mucoidy inhibitor MuiA family protein [Bacteroidales bacterium]
MEHQSVQSKIEEAIVFFQGAELVHITSATLTRGNNELWIGGLSPNVDRNSIKVKTTGNVLVSSFEYSIDHLTHTTSNTQAQKMKSDLKLHQKQLDSIKTEIKINTNLLSILQKSIEKKSSGSESGLSIDELIKTMDYYQTKAGDLEKTLAFEREKEQKLKKTIQELQAQFEQESLKNNKTSGVLKLTLSAPADGICNFTVSYYTNSAGWIPYHDILVTETGKPVKITSKAKVRQITGINWEKVKLTLSTTVPSSGKVAPLFQAWFLQYRQPQTFRQSNVEHMEAVAQNSYSYAKMDMANADFPAIEELHESKSPVMTVSPLYIVDGVPVDANYYASLDRSLIKKIQELDAGQATALYGQTATNGAVVVTLKSSMDDFVSQSENQLNLTFDIDLPYNIPGNGKEQIVELKTQETPATFIHYCAPKLNYETYLLAEIAEWEKLNLLSGAANITYEGTYVGETYIDAASTQENLSLTLGVDKRVAVKREKLKDFSSTGFFGNDVKQEFGWQLIVRNNRNQAIRMVLKDQYPISTIKEVTVELSKNTTSPSFNKTDIGVITWEIDMQPGEIQTFKLMYVVKYPKNKLLNL